MNKGLTLVELLVTLTVLGIVVLGISEFSYNTMNVTDKQAAQLSKAEQTRTSAAKIAADIKRAAYIFPSNKQINLYVIDNSYPYNPKRRNLRSGSTSSSQSITVDTSTSIALMIPTNEIDSGSSTNSTLQNTYYVKVYFINDNDLYEFSTTSSIYWARNVIPASVYSSLSGTGTLLAENVSDDGNSLTYYISNGYKDQYDSVLVGGNGKSVSDNDSLVAGAKWVINLNSATGNDSYALKIKGISRNVPRYTN